MDFRGGLFMALNAASDSKSPPTFSRDNATALLEALRGVTPWQAHISTFELEHAVRYILFELWHSSPLADKDIEALLAGCWAGSVLSGMKAHYESRIAARRASDKFDNPANVQMRRDLKKQLKQEQHEMRLNLKKDRDKRWREQGGLGADRSRL